MSNNKQKFAYYLVAQIVNLAVSLIPIYVGNPDNLGECYKNTTGAAAFGAFLWAIVSFVMFSYIFIDSSFRRSAVIVPSVWVFVISLSFMFGNLLAIYDGCKTVYFARDILLIGVICTMSFLAILAACAFCFVVIYGCDDRENRNIRNDPDDGFVVVDFGN